MMAYSDKHWEDQMSAGSLMAKSIICAIVNIHRLIAL
ncbi:hypothetical protein Pvag_pPag30447 (plasmid) [Pantoea vagans C9-1]|nr:hypothetical protein Pvag_pPag30447 [Pantoea vagans C9-1]